MYIVKNALLSIRKSKTKQFFTALIVFVIAFCSCIGLSIRQASQSIREDTLSNLSIRATISLNRNSMMKENMDGQTFDRSGFDQRMENISTLTLEQYQTFAQAQSVSDFYYSFSSSVNSTNLDVIEDMNGRNKKGFDIGLGSFSLIGYEQEKAMEDFVEGSNTIVQGNMFSFDKADLTCILPSQLATYNNIQVGDSIEICNTDNEEVIVSLQVSGIYESDTMEQENQILVGNKTYEQIEKDLSLNSMINAQYLFDSIETYEQFEQEAKELGMPEEYAITSQDLMAFENSLNPLNSLSKMAGYFLIVILVIGSVSLVVFNILQIRQRKYEIGVLYAMGMSKFQVCFQFIIEIFIVTFLSLLLGTGLAAISSVPVTNALLENQVENQNQREETFEMNFGKSMNGRESINPEATMITQISSATDVTVWIELAGIGLLLTIISGMGSVLIVMRCQPYQILTSTE
ncbi:MAG: ABC transporter permease [Floccifex sp.]